MTHAQPEICALEALHAEAACVVTLTLFLTQHDHTYLFPEQDLSQGGPTPC